MVTAKKKYEKIGNFNQWIESRGEEKKGVGD